MLFSSVHTLPVIALAATSLASPIVANTAGSVQRRQAAEEMDLAMSVGQNIMDLYKDIKDMNDEQHQAESDYTQQTVTALQAAHPDKNVIVYHNPDSKTNFVNGVHVHYELDLKASFGQTEGYEIWYFDSGSFDLSGDGGDLNWCFSGSFTRNGKHVDFTPMKTVSPPSDDSGAAGQSSSKVLPTISFGYGTGFGSSNSSLSKGQANGGSKALQAPVNYSPPALNGTLILPRPGSTAGSKAGQGSKDGNYFVQCGSTNGTTQLGVAYYKTLSPKGGNKGQQPDDVAWLSETSNGSINGTASAHGQWSHPVGAIIFNDTQTTIHWNLFGKASDASIASGQTVGFADNGSEHFWMYKDDGSTLFTQGDLTCNSLYYAS